LSLAVLLMAAPTSVSAPETSGHADVNGPLIDELHPTLLPLIPTFVITVLVEPKLE
jgi:mannose/fructose/N-acetylgalactosamine-specific phosphotransferase system component IID